jgi:Uma2 family endonuclease
MGLPKFKTKISVEDYLEGEKISLIRREFLYGEVFPILQNNINHNRICGNIVTELNLHMRKGCCEPFFHSLKVRVNSEVYFYPDVLVSCEQNPEDPQFRNNPILIIEVTSQTTESIDRREKVFLYQQIASLQEYAVVDQYRMEIQIHRRQPDGGWNTYFFTEDDDVVVFASIDLTIPLPEIYRRVTFDPNANRNEF